MGDSITTLLREFILIESADVNKIESVLALNNNLPEFNMICSPANMLGSVGGLRDES